MKYYIYVSDSKVDMLLSQMPRDAKRKIATEFKIDLKLLGASRKAERSMKRIGLLDLSQLFPSSASMEILER